MFNRVFSLKVLIAFVFISLIDNIDASNSENALDIVESNVSNTRFEPTVATTLTPRDLTASGDEITSFTKKTFWGLASVSAAAIGVIGGD